jgi:hypothetical protein
MSIPCSSFSRASTENFTSLAAIVVLPKRSVAVSRSARHSA